MMRLIEVAARSVVIVSIGGGADVVIAKAIAMTMIREGATSVDIVQTKARTTLDREETLQDLGELRLSRVGTFGELEFLEYLTPIELFKDARLEGWSQVSEGNLQDSFADDLESCLRETSCWLDEPLKWDAPDSLWSYRPNMGSGRTLV